MMLKKLLQCGAVILSFLLLAGCFSANYPEQHTYMLHVTMPKQQKYSGKNSLTVTTPFIVPQFANNTFVYRTSRVNYLTDHYNAFFIPPNQQIKQQISEYLSRTGLFNRVIDYSNGSPTQFILQTKISALYADYRNNQNPQGAIAIQFTLLQIDNKKSHLLFEKTFSESVSLKEKDSESLVIAWNQGLQKILNALATQLRKTPISLSLERGE